MTTAKPVTFDIEVRRSPVKEEPAVKKRLEMQAGAAAPSLEDIEAKLKRAEEIRRAKLFKEAFRTDERITRVLERKTFNEAHQLKKMQMEMEIKAVTAEQLRLKAIQSKVEVAKRNSCKLVLQRKTTQERDQVQKMQQELVTRLETAEQKRIAALQSVVLTAKKNSAKLDKAKQAKLDQEQEKEAKLKLELEKVQQQQQKSLEMQQKIALKAKSHVQKVHQTVSAQREKQAQALEAKRSGMQSRLQKAQQKRGQQLERVRQTAQELAHGRSSSKDVPPTANAAQ